MTPAQPLRILIVDDEAPARNRIRDLLSDCALKMPIEIAGEAENGKRALDMLPECDADVILLDVRMPEIDGIEVAQHVQKLDEPPTVIFTTAYDAYALKAFEVHAIDYLLKPIRLGRLFDALSRARTIIPLRLEVLRELKPEARTHLSVNERGRIHLIPMSSVVFLKAELKYVTVRTAQREFLLEESLAKLEQEFLGRFVRVHRNCLVAKDAVRGFERATDTDGEGHWEVVLKDVPEKLAVSRRQQHIVREFENAVIARRAAALVVAIAAIATAAAAEEAALGVLDVELGASYARLAHELDFRDINTAIAQTRSGKPDLGKRGYGCMTRDDPSADIDCVSHDEKLGTVDTREVRLHFLQGRLQQFSLTAEVRHYDAVLDYLRRRYGEPQPGTASAAEATPSFKWQNESGYIVAYRGKDLAFVNFELVSYTDAVKRKREGVRPECS